MSKPAAICKSDDLLSFEKYFEGMDIDFLLSQVSGGANCFGSIGTAGTAGTAGGTAGTFGSGSSNMCVATGPAKICLG